MRTSKFVRDFLMIVGLLSLVSIVSLSGYVFYKYKTRDLHIPSLKKGLQAKLDQYAFERDMRFILEACDINTNRITKVVHNHFSREAPITGENLYAQAIQLESLTVEELNLRKDGSNRWYRGDFLPKIVEEAVDFTQAWLGYKEMPWFPTIGEIRSPKTFIKVEHISFDGTSINEAEIIFAQPETKMIYYFRAKL